MMITGKQNLSGLIIFLLFFAAFMQAQEPVKVTRSDNKVILEGKVYYIHIVKPGQTLYSIARAYNVTEKQILIENQGSSANLLVGQVLKIPSLPTTAFSVDTKDDHGDGPRHIMKPGETLYSLSRIYNCSVDEILELNPGLDINDIPVGYELTLPSEEEELNELSFDEQGFIYHKVKKGETLYSIARYYEVSVREIRAVNAELGWGGPRSGDVIRIPQPFTTFEDIFTADTMHVDTLQTKEEIVEAKPVYSYDELEHEEHYPGRMYRIAYLIPFNYSPMEPLDSLIKNVRSARRIEMIRNDYNLEKQTPKSVNFLEFLEGSLLAIDSLVDAGAVLDVKFYDTKRSMYKTSEILKYPELANADLIIGPFYSFNIELVTEYSRNNKIPLITPFHSSDTLLEKNPYLFQTNPSYKTEYKRNAEFISRAYDSNLIFVHNGDSADMEKMAYYKRALFEELAKYSAQETVMFKEVIIDDRKTENLIHSLNPNVRNVIILPSTDEAFASQVASRIYYELEHYDIELFGSSYWVGFNDIEISYIHALHLKISHTNWYDHTDPAYQRFLEKFRVNYLKEPGTFTRQGFSFGVEGYDVSLYFISALQKYGPRFILHLNELQVPGTLRNYSFERISESGGYENKAMKYYYFNEDMNVTQVNLPEQSPLHQYMRPAGDDPLYFRRMDPQPDAQNIKDR
ncbi:MAG: LysM peptidoglycan-binding domain-containing protein [Bacteroidales bacterium]